MIGPRAVEAIRAYRAGIAFLGVPALDSVHGFTADGDVEAATDLAFIDSAQRCVVLADHTKLGRVATTHVVPLTAIDTVVTDTGAPTDAIADLQGGGDERHRRGANAMTTHTELGDPVPARGVAADHRRA